MTILLILVTGTVAGLLPGFLGLDRLLRPANVGAGIAGALAGAFLGFGDAPLLLEYPFLNEKSLMVAGAILFVIVRIAVAKTRASR